MPNGATPALPWCVACRGTGGTVFVVDAVSIGGGVDAGLVAAGVEVFISDLGASGSAVEPARTAFVAPMDVISPRFRFASRSRTNSTLETLAMSPTFWILTRIRHARGCCRRTGIDGRHRHGDERLGGIAPNPIPNRPRDRAVRRDCACLTTRRRAASASGSRRGNRRRRIQDPLDVGVDLGVV